MERKRIIQTARGEVIKEEPLKEGEAVGIDLETVIDTSDGTVICDLCSVDYTFSLESGGLTMGSSAYCPACAPGIEANAIKYKEAHHIRHRCPEGMPFAQWVRDILRKNYREGVTTIITVKT